MLLNLMVIALLVVAVALGLNNFGAATAIGVGGVDRRTEVKVATVFGLCEVVMPAAGMLIGTGLAGPLGSAARWAGAGILFVTAVWGLIEALRGGEDAPKVWHGWRLLVRGAALSLDDLAVGLALGTVRYPIVLAVAPVRAHELRDVDYRAEAGREARCGGRRTRRGRGRDRAGRHRGRDADGLAVTAVC
jgi:putative Mn2+ efflux pump MntP